MKNITHSVRLLIAAAAFTLALAPCATHADTPAVSIGGGSSGSYTGTSTTIGFSFTLSSAQTVTNLGFYDFFSDGLMTSHAVGLWDNNGNLLAQATVPAGTAGTLTDGFRYIRITDLPLTAGTYTVGGFESNLSGGSEVIAYGRPVTPAPGITYNGPRNVTSPSLAYPSGQDSDFGNAFGANLEFSAVPEPSTWALAGLGLTACGVAMIRRRHPATA